MKGKGEDFYACKTQGLFCSKYNLKIKAEENPMARYKHLTTVYFPD